MHSHLRRFCAFVLLMLALVAAPVAGQPEIPQTPAGKADRKSVV